MAVLNAPGLFVVVRIARQNFAIIAGSPGTPIPPVSRPGGSGSSRALWELWNSPRNWSGKRKQPTVSWGNGTSLPSLSTGFLPCLYLFFQDPPISAPKYICWGLISCISLSPVFFFLLSIDPDTIKVCPRCGAFIMKINDGSCNRMNCTVCGCLFCWLCMQEITDVHFLRCSKEMGVGLATPGFYSYPSGLSGNGAADQRLGRDGNKLWELKEALWIVWIRWWDCNLISIYGGVSLTKLNCIHI